MLIIRDCFGVSNIYSITEETDVYPEKKVNNIKIKYTYIQIIMNTNNRRLKIDGELK
jgi:hypothetical protein